MLQIVRGRSKPTPIVRDRLKPKIQRSKTVFYTSKLNFNAQFISDHSMVELQNFLWKRFLCFFVVQFFSELEY